MGTYFCIHCPRIVEKLFCDTPGRIFPSPPEPKSMHKTLHWNGLKVSWSDGKGYANTTCTSEFCPRIPIFVSCLCIISDDVYMFRLKTIGSRTLSDQSSAGVDHIIYSCGLKKSCDTMQSCCHAMEAKTQIRTYICFDNQIMDSGGVSFIFFHGNPIPST